MNPILESIVLAATGGDFGVPLADIANAPAHEIVAELEEWEATRLVRPDVIRRVRTTWFLLRDRTQALP